MVYDPNPNLFKSSLSRPIKSKQRFWNREKRKSEADKKRLRCRDIFTPSSFPAEQDVTELFLNYTKKPLETGKINHKSQPAKPPCKQLPGPHVLHFAHGGMRGKNWIQCCLFNLWNVQLTNTPWIRMLFTTALVRWTPRACMFRLSLVWLACTWNDEYS